MRYRLIKPNWANQKHPSFVEEIPGPDTLEGENFTPAFLKTKNKEGYNIYYFPNHNSKKPQGKFLRGEDVDVFNYLFVDMDLKDNVYETKEAFVAELAEFPYTPNFIVDSGHGIHAYWKVSDLDRDSYMEFQLRLITYFKTDESIWTPCQLMRCPGYKNTKVHGEYTDCDQVECSNEVYKTKDFDKVLDQLNDISRAKMAQHIRKLEGIEEVDLEDVDEDEIPEKFTELLEKSSKARKLFEEDGESGKRSEKDLALANLLFTHDFSKKDALRVLMNTEKARSKGTYRKTYAAATVEKAYSTRGHTVLSRFEHRQSGKKRQKGRTVNGPSWCDCLVESWRTKQCLGLVGGTGVGKTSATLDMFKAMADEGDKNDIFIFFSLEMTEDEIYDAWDKLTVNDEDLARRFFVVTNEDENGDPRNINLQKIWWFVRDIEKSTGKKAKGVAVDHIGIINSTIDVSQKPNFGLEGYMEGAFGDLRTVSSRHMTKNLKSLSKSLDVFLIIQSQTTKAKAAGGDVPLEVDSAYGAAQFEHDMDYVMTIWQPLRRVQDKTEMWIMGWQYCKIRNRRKGDQVIPYEKRTLLVDQDTGEMRPLTDDEYQEFEPLKLEADELRKRAEKKQSTDYKNSPGPSVKKLKKLMQKRA